MKLTAEDAARLLEIGMIVWLAVLAGVAMYALLLRGRAFNEMMTGPSGHLDPERVLEFFVTIGIAGYYALSAGSAIPNAAGGEVWMPDIPESLLVVLAGGKSLFLAGKISRAPR